MEGIAKHIDTGNTTTTLCSSVINICQCNRNDDTVKPISENYESSTCTSNIHSLYTINDNIEHGNIHRIITHNGTHPSRNSVSNNISIKEDFNQTWILSKTNSRKLVSCTRGNNYISPVNKMNNSSN